MPSPGDDEVWSWEGPGTPDKRPDRGRIYYKKLSVHRANNPTKKRHYRVGDPVVMLGDEGQSWIAQIVDLFEAKESDIELRELLRLSTARNAAERRYELMRCTLRWFYNLSDMNKHTINTSRVPKPVPGEIWFSDHVEKDGYNDIQVIEGRAWLFPSLQALQVFQKQPHAAFQKEKDLLRIVRCFVDSNIDYLPVRELVRGELDHLLRNPSTAKDMYDTSLSRVYGTAEAVIKGHNTKKRKRRHTTLRSPVNVHEDEFDPRPRGKKSRSLVVEGKVELGLDGETSPQRSKGRTNRRRRVISNEDDDDESKASPDPNLLDDDEDPMDNQPLAHRASQPDSQQHQRGKTALNPQQQSEARNLAEENRQVVELVSFLNDNAFDEAPELGDLPADVPAPALRPGMSVEISDAAPMEKKTGRRMEPQLNRSRISAHKDRLYQEPNKSKPSTHRSRKSAPAGDLEVIDLDSDEVLEKRPRPSSSRPTAQLEPKVGSKAQRNSHSSMTAAAAKGRPTFMPTSRVRKPSADMKTSKRKHQHSQVQESDSRGDTEVLHVTGPEQMGRESQPDIVIQGADGLRRSKHAHEEQRRSLSEPIARQDANTTGRRSRESYSTSAPDPRSAQEKKSASTSNARQASGSSSAQKIMDVSIGKKAYGQARKAAEKLPGADLRQGADQASHKTRKLETASRMGQDVPPSAQSRSNAELSLRNDTGFWTEIGFVMDKLRREFGDLAGENRALVYKKIDWLLESGIDKLFDGGSDRARKPSEGMDDIMGGVASSQTRSNGGRRPRGRGTGVVEV